MCLFDSSKETRDYALLRAGLAKKFMEEVYPLSFFVGHRYSGRSDVRVKPNLGNENYDAEIIDLSVNPPSVEKIEFTQAINEEKGHQEHLRMHYFLEHGHVPLLGKVKHQGTERTGLKIEVCDDFVARSEKVEEALQLVVSAAQGKAAKPYGKDTSLVIVFDDYDKLKDPEDICKLKRRVIEEILPMDLNFYKLFLLGISGRNLMEFSLPDCGMGVA